jgi:hypothetical protein
MPWSHDIHVQLPTVACRPRKKLVMRTPANGGVSFRCLLHLILQVLLCVSSFAPFCLMTGLHLWRVCGCQRAAAFSGRTVFRAVHNCTQDPALFGPNWFGFLIWVHSFCFHCSAYTLCLVRGLFDLIATFLKVF